MVRLKILVSAVPLLVAAWFAREDWSSGVRPCIAAGSSSVSLAVMPWQGDVRVAFTDDPQAATVRVRIADSADAADFAVVDDANVADGSACAAGDAMRFVAIAARAGNDDPLIYLANEGPADFTVFVQSRSFTARDAAALIVGARPRPARLAAAL